MKTKHIKHLRYHVVGELTVFGNRILMLML